MTRKPKTVRKAKRAAAKVAKKTAAKVVAKQTARILSPGVIVGKKKRARGNELGSYLSRIGSRVGRTVGTYAHSFIDKIVGVGDYTIVPGGAISTTGGQMVPQFSKGRNPIVSHREYICDIFSSTGFNVQSFNINPGLASTFPWLYNLAVNYEQYKLKGCVFEFKSTSANALNSTNTALGTVIMATNYDVLDSNFASKLTMENYDMAMSCKPAESMLHGVECSKRLNPLSELFVRQTAVPTGADARLYDLGKFQIATYGMQAANVNIGELWVTYEVELIKPKLGQQLGQNIVVGRWNESSYVYNSDGSISTSTAGAATATFPFGSTLTTSLRVPTSGSTVNLSQYSVSGNNVYIAQPGSFMILYFGALGTAPTGAPSAPTLGGAASPGPTIFPNNNYGMNFWLGAAPTNAGGQNYANYAQCNAFTITSSASPGNLATVQFTSAASSGSQYWSLIIIPIPSGLTSPVLSPLEEIIKRLELLENNEEEKLCNTPELIEENEIRHISDSTLLARAISKLSSTQSK